MLFFPLFRSILHTFRGRSRTDRIKLHTRLPVASTRANLLSLERGVQFNAMILVFRCFLLPAFSNRLRRKKSITFWREKLNDVYVIRAGQDVRLEVQSREWHDYKRNKRKGRINNARKLILITGLRMHARASKMHLHPARTRTISRTTSPELNAQMIN
jgi:hypothetical protein